MKTRFMFLILAVLLASAQLCVAADDPSLGTWKLDEAKSKLAEGAPKNTTVVYEAAGDSIKITIDGVGTDGKPTHNEWTGKFDGKDYPVVGDSSSTSRSYKRINAHTLHAVNKKDGKETLTAHIVVSADGKSRTVTTTSTDASGKKVTGTAVYNKQ